MTLDLLKHFGAAAIALTICLALFVGDNAAEVEDAQIATKQLSHKAGKAAVAGNDKVAKAGGGVIIGMTTRSIPRSSGSWGSAAGVGGGGAPADGGANAPAPQLASAQPQGPEWEGGPNMLPPGHPANMTRNPEQSQAAGAPRSRKKGAAEAPTAQQLNDIIEASRKRSNAGGSGA